MAKTYAEKLRDPRWQRKRLEVLNRSDFTCERCGSGEKTLNVHHKRYKKGHEPWEYEDHELQALCQDCHLQIHEDEEFLHDCIEDLCPYDLARVRGFAKTLAVLRNKHVYPDDIPIQYLSVGAFHGSMSAVGMRPELIKDFAVTPIPCGELRSMAKSNGVDLD